MMRRRKECRFCSEGKDSISPFDSKLGRYLTDKGKIVNRRITGVCAKHQRKLSRAIKKARNLGILPYVAH
ncbi:30S ribosomal protein S18 [candidate division WOR-3 bacterium]|uniref:Small ribosomal subunit protein bS18 n=1 Tax=candidate division WOR-3 bacterium TaxID=2052148 RepID=A0A9D5K749_UNCW3|nr:30S ribosomal protein S18 [candidate division WOR-3 bacterium]MBD3363588.1 30S ribosomal protein S18 [candidate division WOR-3 bacterium]